MSGGNITPYYSAQRGDIDLVCKALGEGMAIDEQDEIGRTLMHYAAYYDRFELLTYLIEQGASPDIADNNGSTPLIQAAPFSLRVVEYLIQQGASVNTQERGYDQFTALHCAAKKGKLRLVKLLLEQGARIDSKSAGNSTPFNKSIYFNHIDCAEYLLEQGADINNAYNAQYEEGITSLHFALNDGFVYSEELVKFLLNHGADVSVKDSMGNTALHKAVQDDGIVVKMIEAAHNINAQNNEGKSVLHYAASEGALKSMKNLLADPSIDLSCQDNNQQAALFYSANIDIAQLLIKAGANIDFTQSQEQLFMPLYGEIQVDKEELKKLLGV